MVSHGTRSVKEPLGATRVRGRTLSAAVPGDRLWGQGSRHGGVMGEEYASAVSRHYAGPDLAERITLALSQAGMDEGPLAPDDLAPLDQFHTRGRAATLELAQLAQLRPGIQVLDIGGGIGGPARTLAAEYRCRVTVLDITDAYCRVGEMLTLRTGLDDLVRFRRGDALHAPFADQSFDVVWMQHANMNIDDKERLYAEAHRVLRRGGRLAIHEIAAATETPVHFPVPWASEPGISFLRPVAWLQAAIEAAGFECLAFRDGTDAALAWFRERVGAGGEPPPLGLHLLLGGSFRPAFQNLLRNLEEQRLAVIAAVYRK